MGSCLHVRLRGTGPQQLQTIANRCEWIAQFVAEHRQELVLVAVGLSQRLFIALLRRDIARDLGGADDLSSPVTNRRNGNRYIDHAAVLPAAPRLIVIEPLAGA